MDVTTAHEACFELGIKFGSLYHQFAGTPVSPNNTRSLERAIEEAIANQPHCRDVTVLIDDEAIEESTNFGYTELTGVFMDVEIEVECEDVTAIGRMDVEDGYPLMQIETLEK